MNFNFYKVILQRIILSATTCLMLSGGFASCAVDKKNVENEDTEKLASTLWHDTLSNELSDIPDLQPLDADIERFMMKYDIRGLSLAITRNDSLLYAKGYGWADKEANIRMAPTTETRLASVSKLLTAVAIMRMVDEKKISLSSRVFGPKGILNDSSIIAKHCDSRIFDITVNQLLCHYAGFSQKLGDPMFRTMDYMQNFGLKAPPSKEELVRIVTGWKLASDPGTNFKYSNFGYLLLSMIIEKVSGKSYWDYLAEEIFKPVGATAFHPAGNYLADRYPFEAKYYSPDPAPVDEYNGSGKLVNRVYGGADIHGLMGGGGWIGSAPALARLIAAVDGDNGVPDILSAESIRSMTQYDPKRNLAKGWIRIDSVGNWTRTGTLASAHVFAKKYADGECWVITTNTGVYLGFNFSRQMGNLAERLRRDYSSKLPRRNLW